MSEILESVGLKTCSKCEQTLPISEFAKNDRSKDGLHYVCRPCDRKRITQWRDENREHVNEQAHQWHDENRDHLNKLCQQRRLDPEEKRKHQVRHITNLAIIRGELIRPDACPQCGTNDRTIEAHHLSYEYGCELEIMWLCPKCHRALHQRNKID